MLPLLNRQKLLILEDLCHAKVPGAMFSAKILPIKPSMAFLNVHFELIAFLHVDSELMAILIRCMDFEPWFFFLWIVSSWPFLYMDFHVDF